MTMEQEIINATEKRVTPLSISEVNRIASIHANNGFSMKATASQLECMWASSTGSSTSTGY